MGFIAAWLISKKVPDLLAKILGWVIPGAILALGLWFAIHTFQKNAEAVGANKNEEKHQEAHAVAVGDARHDEAGAQISASAIGAKVAEDNADSRSAVSDTKEELHHAINVAPSAPAGAVTMPPTFDSSGVLSSLNGLVDRANGASEKPDARR